MSSFSLHPASRLLAWMAYALAIMRFSPTALAASSALLLFVYIFLGRPKNFGRYLARIRVLLLVLIVLYGYTTPGEPVFAAWGGATPSWEGLHAGTLQAWRLLLIVGSLSVALATLDSAALVSGIYVLLLPLRALGLPTDRLTTRLWLTLHYADGCTVKESLSARWEQACVLPQTMQQPIEFEMPPFTLHDFLFGLICALVLGLALW